MIFKEYIDMAMKIGISNEIIIDAHFSMRSIYNKMDPSIRLKLQKRGITLTNRIYTGFDTEYVNRDMSFNELLSVQLSVCSRVMIQLPLKTPYDIVSINTLNNKKYDVTQGVSKRINIKRMCEDATTIINAIRLLNYHDYDCNMEFLIEVLKKQKFKHIIDYEKEKITFILDPKQPKT
jgi:hypothetical protein